MRPGAVNQYVEIVPTAGGGRPSSDIHPGGVGGGATAGGEAGVTQPRPVCKLRARRRSATREPIPTPCIAASPASRPVLATLERAESRLLLRPAMDASRQQLRARQPEPIQTIAEWVLGRGQGGGSFKLRPDGRDRAYGVSPEQSASLSDDVAVPNVWKIGRVLNAAARAGHVLPRAHKDLWVTELGWNSRPMHHTRGDAALRRSSRAIVDGDRPSRRAISRTPTALDA